MIDLYQLVRPALFALDAERAHDLVLDKLGLLSNQATALSILRKIYADRVPELLTDCMGLSFRHPIGLAAGLDKNAIALPALAALGFSGVELGTVTPKPQPGNDRPRMFRLPQDQAIINRMGFNSGGVEPFCDNLKRYSTSKHNAVCGINVGKNAQTDLHNAHNDYVSAMQKVYGHADYIAINISSPNTKSLRDLQNADYLDDLLLQIKTAQQKCEKVHQRYVPIALKISPDLDEGEIEAIAELVLSHQFDAVIATNTTTSRSDMLRSRYARESGGLSGKPLNDLSTLCIARFYRHLKDQVQIIAVGGIDSAEVAWEKLLAGADYLQIYTPFIYHGPGLIATIVNGLQSRLEAMGEENLNDAVRQLRD